MSSRAASQSATASAENILKKLRKLETNMTCPNCGTPAQAGVGFGNVCVKFKTFVCDLCKFVQYMLSVYLYLSVYPIQAKLLIKRYLTA